MKKMFMLAVFVLVPLFSQAQGLSDGGRISSITSLGYVLIFTLSGNKEVDRPDCATTKRFAVQAGSTHVPVIISAFSGGKKVGNVRGLGSCSQSLDSEDLKWIQLVE
ncbi:hypothetical protein A9Q90_04485 [Gammaproteobacteria bacterium 54_18_T64]|nr:hypothetical protein A9Q90_04485 [Gammaproteobacteria bacterium 54_18_T64]